MQYSDAEKYICTDNIQPRQQEINERSVLTVHMCMYIYDTNLYVYLHLLNILAPSSCYVCGTVYNHTHVHILVNLQQLVNLKTAIRKKCADMKNSILTVVKKSSKKKSTITYFRGFDASTISSDKIELIPHW